MASRSVRDKVKRALHRDSAATHDDGPSTSTPAYTPSSSGKWDSLQSQSSPNYLRPNTRAPTETTSDSSVGKTAAPGSESEALQKMYSGRNWTPTSNESSSQQPSDRTRYGLPERPMKRSGYYDRVRQSNLDERQRDSYEDERAADSRQTEPDRFHSNDQRTPRSDFGEASRDTAPQLPPHYTIPAGIDLSNTEDTTYHERQAPAVVHETIKETHHEIREIQIEREIHEHHVFHRILPVRDIEVLPARHFVHDDRGSAEIPESEVPGRARQNIQEKIAQAFALPSTGETVPSGPRQFTARTFEGTEGDYREGIAPEGHVISETTWVHPPTLQTGGRDTGQTEAFHFGVRQRPPSGQQQQELLRLQRDLEQRSGNNPQAPIAEKRELMELKTEVDNLVASTDRINLRDETPTALQQARAEQRTVPATSSNRLVPYEGT